MAARLQRLRDHLVRCAEWYWAPALYAIAVLFLFRDLWAVGDGIPAGFGWDAIESYSPDMAFLSAEVGELGWPLWNPYDRGGYPFIADPQPGAYYPFGWLFIGVGAVAGVGWWLVQLKILAHFVAAGASMHLFLRSRGLSRPAAIVGGMAVMSTAPMLIHKASNLLWPMVWTPLLWVAIDRVLERPSWRRGALLAAAIVLVGSAGSPPGFFYVLIMGVLYGVFRAGAAIHRAHRGAELARFARGLGVALAVAAAISLAMLAVTVFPGLDLSEYTGRAASHRGLGYALSGSIPISKVLTGMVAPTTGMNDVYCGIAVLTLALAALAMRPLRDRGAPIFLIVLACLGLMLAFGQHTPLLAWLVEHLPGFELFRIAGRYKIITSISLSALAGFGAAALLDAPRSTARERIAGLLSIAAMIALVLVIVSLYSPSKPPAWLRSTSRPITLVLVVSVLIAGALFHRRRAASLTVLALAFFAVWDPNHYVHSRGLAVEARRHHEGDRALIDSLAIGHDHRIYDEFVLEQRAGSRLRVRDFRGYPSLDPLSLRRYNEVLEYARKEPRILEAYNVKYVLHGPHHRNRGSAFLSRPPDRVAPDHFRATRPKVYEGLHPAPLVAWYGGITVVKSASESLAAVLASEDASGERRLAVLEETEITRAADPRINPLVGQPSPPLSVSGELLEFKTDRIVVRIDAPSTGLVVLNEVAYPGWQVEIDGREATPLRANHILRAAIVDAGRHELTWRFKPRRARLYLILWWLGLIALGAALLVSIRARRHS